MLIFLIAVAPANAAFGAPFLVSDPYPANIDKPVRFLVTIDKKTDPSTPVEKTDGSVYLKYDLGNLPDGAYAVSVEAVDGNGMKSVPIACSIKKTGAVAEFSSPPAPKVPLPAEMKRRSAEYPGRQQVGQCTKFLDKTAGLRKDFGIKRQEYWGLKGDPKARPEDLAKRQEEVRALWKIIQDQNPGNCRWQD